jgi:hypothetical protein
MAETTKYEEDITMEELYFVVGGGGKAKNRNAFGKHNLRCKKGKGEVIPLQARCGPEGG